MPTTGGIKNFDIIVILITIIIISKYFICSMENMQENRTQDELIGPLSFPA